MTVGQEGCHGEEEYKAGFDHKTGLSTRQGLSKR